MGHLHLLRSRLNSRDLILLSIIVISLIAIICGLLLFFIPIFENHGIFIMTLGQTVAEWTGLILLVLNGTVMKTKYWKYIIAGGLLLVISALFIILHLPWGRELMFAGLVFIELTYTVRFIQRRYASLFDWMKYIWTGAWYSATIFIVFMNWSEGWWLVSDALFWITITIFLTGRLNHTVQQSG